MKTGISRDFDMIISYDNNLQEVPNNTMSFYKRILQLERKLFDENDILKKSKMISQIGVLYRIQGDNLKSEKYLLSALDLIDKSKDKKIYLIAVIRLAHTYQKQQKFELSSKLFKESEILCNENENLKNYLDFVYQHIGKLKFDMKKYEEARLYFEKALELRITKGDKELLGSTNFALKIVKNKLTI